MLPRSARSIAAAPSSTFSGEPSSRESVSFGAPEGGAAFILALLHFRRLVCRGVARFLAWRVHRAGPGSAAVLVRDTTAHRRGRDWSARAVFRVLERCGRDRPIPIALRLLVSCASIGVDVLLREDVGTGAGWNGHGSTAHATLRNQDAIPKTNEPQPTLPSRRHYMRFPLQPAATHQKDLTYSDGLDRMRNRGC